MESRVYNNEDDFKRVFGRVEGELRSYIHKIRAEDQKYIKLLERKTSLNSNSTVILSENERNVTCLIDGSVLSFTSSLLKEPLGGMVAARKLSNCLRASDNLDGDGSLRISTYIFLNKQSVSMSTGVSVSTIDAFINSFNEAVDHATFMVCVGDDDMVVSRLKDILQQALLSRDTWKVVLGGCYSNAYAALLENHDASFLNEKVLLLRTGSEIPARIRALGLWTVKATPALFEAVSTPVPAATYNVVTGSQDAGCVEERLSTLSPVSMLTSPPTSPSMFDVPVWRSRRQRESSTESNGKTLNPNVKIWENNPPPCNMHYLLGTCKNKFCQRGHDYIVTESDKLKMRVACQNRPCDSVKKGIVCQFGEGCLFGHFCLWGLECRYLAEEKCIFGGAKFHQNQ